MKLFIVFLWFVMVIAIAIVMYMLGASGSSQTTNGSSTPDGASDSRVTIVGPPDVRSDSIVTVEVCEANDCVTAGGVGSCL